MPKVFDVGVTDDRRPYFVMELVRGLSITDYCDQHNLQLRERLQLMVDVCSAVHHAHQKGVIHRDIKPSNVMVTSHDGKPVAKVIDFGVAKAIGRKLTDRTVYTGFYSMIGTPLYMSPEQAEMSGLDVDTRSDIYSLGTLLYELLVGATPFDRRRMESATYDEMRRIILQEDPPKPSTRISTLASERVHSTDSAIRASTLRNDLDWIIMKSLEKDRTRRYESASALAADIQRFLQAEPISARPPSVAYLLSRFARRNRIAIGTAASISCALVLGLAMSLWQLTKTIEQKGEADRALREAVQAKAEAVEANQKMQRFAENLARSNVLVARGETHADNGRWQKAMSNYDEAVRIQPDYFLPYVQRAQLYTRLRLWDQAARDYQTALRMGASTTDPQWAGVHALFLYTKQSDAIQTLSRMSYEQLLTEDVGYRWLSLRGLLVADRQHPFVSVDDLTEMADQWLEERMEHERTPEWRPSRPRNAANLASAYTPGIADSPLSVAHYVTGLAHLRAGSPSAINLFQSASHDRRWPSKYLVWAPLAIAYHQSGFSEEATETLVLSDEAINLQIEEIAILQSDQSIPDSPWFDFLEALLINAEARNRIGGESGIHLERLRGIRDKSRRLIDSSH
ncbi:MAG: serine/threonine-protein kinase [Planctomycetota bacterium]